MTVLIVAYHGAPWLPACLSTLVAASSGRVHLCLVDNSGNGDSIPERIPEMDYEVLRTPRPLGFAEANNFALQQLVGRSEFVCLLNQDTQSGPGWLDTCEQLLRDRPDWGAVSPLLRTYDGSDWDPGFRECMSKSPALMEAARGGALPRDCYEVPRVTAAAVVVRMQALLESGPFDPIFGSYYEDYDLCDRIRRAGYRVGICGAATVCHFSGSSTTTEAAHRRRMRQIARNRAILRIREGDARRWPRIADHLVFILPRNLFRGLLRTPSSQPLTVQLGAQWDLLRQWRRLVSSRCDSSAFGEYLGQLGWPAAGTSVDSAPTAASAQTVPPQS